MYNDRVRRKKKEREKEEKKRECRKIQLLSVDGNDWSLSNEINSQKCVSISKFHELLGLCAIRRLGDSQSMFFFFFSRRYFPIRDNLKGERGAVPREEITFTLGARNVPLLVRILLS